MRREPQRKLERNTERKHDHNRTSSSSRLRSSDKLSGTRSSHRSKELSSKDKGEFAETPGRISVRFLENIQMRN